MKIALDAMGGDHAPVSEVEGAVQAVRHYGVKVALVGKPDQIRSELIRHNWSNKDIEIVPASEVIRMDEPVAKSVRRKRDYSIRVAAQLVREGAADALVSAGNTGAVMMTAKLLLGMLPSVDRPALAAVLPTLTDRGTILLDVGANADCRPEQLAQFAVMGNIYSQIVLGIPKPRVAILSIGEEEAKGNELTKEVAKLLRQDPQLNFIGNVEGRDCYTGMSDVIVCDGFTGNVVLKVSEGLNDVIQILLKEQMLKRLDTKVGAMLVRPAFNAIKKRVDYDEFGGAPLLGTKGMTVICHGRSNAKAIRNAIRVAKEFCEGRVNERIEEH